MGVRANLALQLDRAAVTCHHMLDVSVDHGTYQFHSEDSSKLFSEKVVPGGAVVSACPQTALLENGVPSRRNKDRCGLVFR